MQAVQHKTGNFFCSWRGDSVTPESGRGTVERVPRAESTGSSHSPVDDTPQWDQPAQEAGAAVLETAWLGLWNLHGDRTFVVVELPLPLDVPQVAQSATLWEWPTVSCLGTPVQGTFHRSGEAVPWPLHLVGSGAALHIREDRLVNAPGPGQ